MNFTKSDNFLTNLNIKHLYIYLILILGVYAAYWGLLNNGFVYDDHELIEQSLLIRSETKISEIFNTSFFEETRGKTGYYRPLTILSYKLDNEVFSINPAGFHFTSLMLHIFCVVALFLFLKEIGLNQFISIAAALIFGLSPFRVQSVAWISARSDILATLFAILALIFFNRYNRNKNPVLSLGLIGIFSFLSFLSKEISVMIPILAFITWYFLPQPKADGSRRKYFPYLVILAAALVYLILRYNALGFLLKTSFSPESWWVPENGLISRLLTVPIIIIWYLYKNIIPFPLSFDRGVKLITSYSNIWIWISSVVIIIWILMIVKTRKKHCYAAMGLSWFLLSILPISNLLPMFESTMDHFSYLPSIGFALAAAYFIYTFKLKNIIVNTLILTIILFSWGALTNSRVKLFKSDLKIFADSVRKNPDSYRANGLFGIALSQAGKHKESIKWLQRSVKILPDFAIAQYNLGISLKKTGEFNKAEATLKKSISLDTDFLLSYYALGDLYLFQQKSAAAREIFTRMTKLSRSFDIYYKIGLSWQQEKNFQKAENTYKSILAENPGYFMALYRLGEIYQLQDKFQEALNYYQKLINLKPDFAEVYKKLSAIFTKTGDKERARICIEKYIKLQNRSF